MHTLTMDLPEEWDSYPVEGLHLLAAGPATEKCEGTAAGAGLPNGAL